MSILRLVIYELNEVPYRVLNSFKDRYPSSNIYHLLDKGSCFETYTEDEGILSPWITWPTVHRGVTNRDHLISDFGQDLTQLNDEYPSFMDILAKNEIKVGLFGSLHSYPIPKDLGAYSFYVPDTFAQGVECFPRELEAFQEFNLKMVDKSGRNVSSGVSAEDAINFIKNLPGLGITLGTVLKLSEQIASELFNPARKVRRRTSQTQIAFDVFYKQLLITKPDCATFFTNHVASSMPRYWPGLFPEDYKNTEFDEEWINLFSGEIDFTMKVADHQIGLLRDFVEKYRDYRLVVMSSMGQAAVDGTEIIKKQLLIVDKTQFMKAMGIGAGSWESRRAMSPRFVFAIADSEICRVAIENIEKIEINGRLINLTVHESGVLVVKLGQGNICEGDLRISYDGQAVDPVELGIANIEIQDATGSYAYHIPNGSLIVYDPNLDGSSFHEMPTISTLEIAPSILENFGLTRNAYMVKSSSILFR